MEAYFGAKKNITLHQHEGDRLFVGDNVPKVETAAGVTVINTEEVGEYILKIPGEHNYINAEFVYRIAQDVFGADGEDIKQSMAQFEGLPHRLQYIGENKGIRFYDDSISTIPHATIAALTALPDTDTVLIGGMDRGIDYDELISYIKTHPGVKYIFAYETGKRIYDEVSSCPECYYEEDLEAAVKLAVDLTTPGRICLLSPAAASYGYFKNFEHRGEMFKQYALKV